MCIISAACPQNSCGDAPPQAHPAGRLIPVYPLYPCRAAIFEQRWSCLHQAMVSRSSIGVWRMTDSAARDQPEAIFQALLHIATSCEIALSTRYRFKLPVYPSLSRQSPLLPVWLAHAVSRDHRRTHDPADPIAIMAYMMRTGQTVSENGSTDGDSMGVWLIDGH